MARTIPCEFCDCVGDVSNGRTMRACPICDGNGKIDYALVTRFALQMEDVNRQNKRLRKRLVATERLASLAGDAIRREARIEKLEGNFAGLRESDGGLPSAA